MKHRHTITSGASAVILLATFFLIVRMSVGDIPVTSASMTGSVLSVTELAPTERIVVDYVGSGCRDYRNWRFELAGGADRRLTVIDAGGSYENGKIHGDQPASIGAISLSARDCRGIDDLLRIYRHPDGSSSSTTTIRVRVSYFRGQERIGVEEFVDQGMIDQWIWRRDQDGMVPVDSGVTPEMVSFPDLVRRAAKAGQAPAPETSVVIRPAESDRTPSGVEVRL